MMCEPRPPLHVMKKADATPKPSHTRRTFVSGLAGSLGAAPPALRPNFLFILADDHAGYILGAAGNKQVETPNLDRLASEGTHFHQHYCNSPVCTPSRQSFFTGLMPSAAGVTVLSTPLSEQKATLARQCQAAGYTTGVFGKMHFNTPSRPGLHGFEHAYCEDAIQSLWQARPSAPLSPNVRAKPKWQPFRDPANIWLNADKLPFPRYAADMKSTFLARQASEFLEQNREKPFALWVSFQEPHSPFDFPIEDSHKFDPRDFAVPRVGPEDAWQIPLIFRDLSPEQKQGIVAAYYTSVRFLDRNVGRVLAKLRDLHLDENTVVVYMADHGYSLGQHGRFEKHCGYDPALHVPLIIRWPKHVRAGHGVEDLTEHIDVAPTVCDLLGLPPLPGMHGQSLQPYLIGKQPSRPRDHIVSQYLENEEAFVKTKQWKYIYCTGRRERTDGYKTDQPTPGRYRRLYDLGRDPGEFTDVQAANPNVVRALDEKLLARFRATHPEARQEPKGSLEAKLDFYLRPRDAKG
jgi:choline-sulfatase